MPYADLTPKELERFWAKVDTAAEPDECWPWTGGRHERGYGLFSVHRHGDRRMWRCHRVVYELAYGVDPGERFVLHTCDNPPCCNPDHLFLGSHRDNMDDRQAKGRQSKGERFKTAKLTEEMVREIRETREAGLPVFPLAKKFGVTHGLIYHVVHKRNWNHVD